GVPPRRRASFSVAEDRKSAPSIRCRPWRWASSVCGWCTPGIEVTWTCQPITADRPLTNTCARLPDAASCGGRWNLRRLGLRVGGHPCPEAWSRCCLSLWRTPARCARVPPRVETDMKAALGVIAAALVFASGCVKQQDWIDRTLVTVDVTGVWDGKQVGTNWARDIVVALQQQGPKVTGEIMNLGTGEGTSAGSTAIQGTVNGDTLSLREVGGQTLRVVLQVTGDEMTGSGDRLNRPFQVSLHRRP